MIINDCAFEPRRYTGPVVPPNGLEDISKGRKSDMGFLGTAQWEREVSGIWTLLLDGNSDYAIRPEARWRDWDNAGTVACWVKSSVLTGDQTIWATSDQGTDVNFIQLRLAQTTGFIEVCQQDGGPFNQITGDVACGDGIYHLCVLTGDTTAGAYVLWVDDVAVGLTVTAGGNTGNWFDAVFDIRDNISVGAWVNTGVEQYFNGNLWGPRYWPYVFTAAQVWALFNKERGWFAR